MGIAIAIGVEQDSFDPLQVVLKLLCTVVLRLVKGHQPLIESVELSAFLRIRAPVFEQQRAPAVVVHICVVGSRGNKVE